MDARASRRVLAAVPVMGVVALFVFLLLRLTPGDPAAILAGDNASPEQLDRIRTSLGLNDPPHTQFFTWVGKLLPGQPGGSLISNGTVREMNGQRAPRGDALGGTGVGPGGDAGGVAGAGEAPEVLAAVALALERVAEVGVVGHHDQDAALAIGHGPDVRRRAVAPPL